jgi:hypothetical protein
LWERQVKGALCAYGLLDKVHKSRLEGVKEEDWNDIQEQTVSTMILYLQPLVLKEIGEHEDSRKLLMGLVRYFIGKSFPIGCTLH